MIRVCARLGLLLALLGNPVAADEFEDRIAAAERGDSIDQYDIGSAYYFGNDVAQDYKQAYIWYSVAADTGWDKAIARRDKSASQLTPEDLEQAKVDAAALKKKIAELHK